jgi:hypothetical protein
MVFSQHPASVSHPIAGLFEQAAKQNGTVCGVASHRHQRPAGTPQETDINFIGDLISNKIKDLERILAKANRKVGWIHMRQLECARYRQP